MASYETFRQKHQWSDQTYKMAPVGHKWLARRTCEMWTRPLCTQYSGCMLSVRSLPRSWRDVGP